MAVCTLYISGLLCVWLPTFCCRNHIALACSRARALWLSASHGFRAALLLSEKQEQHALALPALEPQAGEPLRVLYIGRLDSYKRLDLLLEALSSLRTPFELAVVGDGPKREEFDRLAERLFQQTSTVRFLGRLDESAKFHQISWSDVLVLPSDTSNEAFGIVQLEAMAAGRPSLAFNQSRSGMGWVGRLSALPWSQSPEGLSEVLQRLGDQPQLRSYLSCDARRVTSLFARSIWLPLPQLGYP